MHLQNYVASCRVQTWSLAVEEHFYLFLPAVLLFLLRLKQMTLLPAVAASIAVFCLVGRFFDLKGAHSYSHLRMDSLFFGVLLAYLIKFSPNFAVAITRRRRLLFCLGAVVVGVISFLNLLDWYVLTIGLTLTYIGFGAILLALISTTETDGTFGKLLFGPIARGIARIGFYSYGIYLWHIEFGFFPALALYPLLIGLPPSLSWLCEMILFVTFSVVFGTLMSRLVELPMLRLRDKIVAKLFPAKPSLLP
jgi:peptidoglycan/LPS O-acetylase OafA/YrhL